MHLPKSSGKKYVVQGRCSLCTWPEFRGLATENATSLGEWMFQDIICRWGGLYEVVTDNAGPFVKALDYLSKAYHINHIHISGYNSRANSIVERSHFDVRQALVKAADSNQSKWFKSLYSVFWAEHITIRK
jgi:hypothetical protein